MQHRSYNNQNQSTNQFGRTDDRQRMNRDTQSDYTRDDYRYFQRPSNGERQDFSQSHQSQYNDYGRRSDSSQYDDYGRRSDRAYSQEWMRDNDDQQSYGMGSSSNRGYYNEDQGRGMSSGTRSSRHDSFDNNIYGRESYDRSGYGQGSYGRGIDYGQGEYGQSFDSRYGQSPSNRDEYGRPDSSSSMDNSRRYGRPYMENQTSRGASFRGKGPKNYSRSDEKIREDLCQRLMDADEIDAQDIDVKVEGGTVTLEGTVDSKNIKYLAEDMAERISGVNDVDNRLRVNRNSGSQSFSSGLGSDKKTDSKSSTSTASKSKSLN